MDLTRISGQLISFRERSPQWEEKDHIQPHFASKWSLWSDQAVYPITLLCRTLDVSTSGYYAWCHRRVSKRAQDDKQLTEQISAFHQRSNGTYGAPRIFEDLRGIGVNTSKARGWLGNGQTSEDATGLRCLGYGTLEPTTRCGHSSRKIKALNIPPMRLVNAVQGWGSGRLLDRLPIVLTMPCVKASLPPLSAS